MPCTAVGIFFFQNLGYSGDIGYQTFLYSSETDVRRIFVFLIEKLPKESEKSILEPTGKLVLVHIQCCVSEVSVCLRYDAMSVGDVQEEILDVSTVEDETTMQPQNDKPVISQKNGYLGCGTVRIMLFWII